MKTYRSKLTLILLLAVAVLAIGAVVALAQPAAPGGDDPFGQPQGPGGNQGQPGGQPGRMMAGGMMMGSFGGPAIAVADGFVFVVQGGTLYKFNAETLELVAKVQFEQPPMMGGMGGMGGGRRGGAGGGAVGGGGGGFAVGGAAGGGTVNPPQ